MRPTLVLLLLSLSLAATINTPRTSSAQLDATTAATPQEAWARILAAFQTLQNAETDGASHDQILELSNRLDTATLAWENATRYVASNDTARAEYYAGLSIGNSTEVSSQAAELDSTAKNQTLKTQIITYTSAFLVALASTTLILENRKIRDWIRRRRENRTRITIGQRVGR